MLESTRNKLTVSLLGARRDAKRLSDAFHEASRALQGARRKVSRMQNECEGLSTRFKATEQGATNELDEVFQQQEKLKATVDTLKADLEKTKSRVSRLNADLSTCSQQLTDAKQAHITAETKATAMQGMLAKARSDRVETQMQAEALANECNEFSISVRALEKAKASLEANLATVNAERATMRRSLCATKNNLVVAHAILRSYYDQISCLCQQLAEKDELETAIVQQNLAEVKVLEDALIEVQDRSDAQGRTLEDTRSELAVERERADQAAACLEAVQREVVRRTEQYVSKCSSLQQEISAITTQLESAKTAIINRDSQLRKVEADRDVYSAQAKQALSVLSSVKRAAAESEKQTEALIVNLRKQLFEACKERDQSKATVRELEVRNGELARRLSVECQVREEAQAELEKALDTSSNTSTQTLVANISHDADVVCALKEAMKAYVEVIDDCDMFCQQMHVGSGRPITSTPTRTRRSNKRKKAVGSEVHSCGHVVVRMLTSESVRTS
ncbi:uncharacterized protein PHACADRAFT_252811 [Phanerochaete carnosa HHB-10118-sp]|uniref:Uncharacterized protein n=1 Tax=Phanerochaete carnosa (strain HHB-10118-sp) TaxID=650164 RepID=K5W3M3_PHACS|nr:uncharacterized protein PHACADRAFT_252811 [Phanerochaete carnosa HHB-10118-sp]EKM58468.1 hypothetical protein PHACADRAFT_252811 [Phanerochaete carnosa HHB-10118-sp]